MGSERKGRGGGWRTLHRGRGSREGHHSSWPGFRTGRPRRPPSFHGEQRARRAAPSQPGGTPGSEAGHRELWVPSPQALPFSLAHLEQSACCVWWWAQREGDGSGLRAGHLAMALGGSRAARCALPAAPVSLGVLTLTSSPRGSGDPQTVAIQT